MATRKTAGKQHVDYVIPASKADTADGQFSFELHGKIYTLPKAQYLPIERSIAAARFESGDFDAGEVRGVFEALFGSAELADVMVALDGIQLAKLMQAWRDASDIAVGESQPSED